MGMSFGAYDTEAF